MRRLGLAVFLMLASAGGARAYPMFQLSTGTKRCSACHVSPSGGGLLTTWGRDESADTIANGGDGRFLHGVWDPPKWLGLSVDLRHAGLVNDVGDHEGPTLASFPMQADLYTRLVFGAWSLQTTVGVRGSTRPVNPPLYSRIVSREHYAMWKPRGSGAFVRVGRFFVPGGLRLAEHILYSRRYAAQGMLEETYNVSGGWTTDRSELHLTLFVPDFIRPVGHRGRGFGAYYERRLDDATALGASAKLTFGPEDDRHLVGVVAKHWFEGPALLVQAELDGIAQTFHDADATRAQLLLHTGVTWVAKRGWYTTLYYERFDEDLKIDDVSRDAVGLQVQWFPRAHFEVHAFGRWQQVGGLDGEPARLAMLMLHWWM